MRILLVEDNEPLAKALALALSEQYYVVDIARDGQEALRIVETFPYDLLLLDVMLPKLDGVSLCRELRTRGYLLPILLLTARDTSTDKVTGLDAGADDYLVKPFDWDELLARIRTLLRRGNCSQSSILTWGEVSLELSSCQVTYQDQLVPLTPTEYRLLELFMRHSNRVFSCGAILEHLWSFEDPPGEETVRSHIKGLRRKLKSAGAPVDLVETVYGLGYRLKPEATEPTATETLPPEPDTAPITPQMLMPQSSRKSQLLKALAASWEQLRGEVLNQVAVLEEAAIAYNSDTLSPEQQRQSLTEAHKLIGLLGTFGLVQGSRLARQIEDLVRSDTLTSAQVEQLEELVATLRSVVEQPIAEPPILQALQDTTTLPKERPFLLIVDDDQQWLEQLLQEAAGWEMEVQRATTLTSARQQIAQRRPDAILLDISFESETENGLTLLADLTTFTSQIPVIILSNYGDFADRQSAVRLGAWAFLQKPIPVEQVLAIVTQALQPSSITTAEILAVDDDPQVLAVSKTLLEPWGMRVTTLEDSRQFWETLEETLPDLLILDVELNHHDGVELCRVVRNDPRWSGLPILFLTAHTDSGIVQQVFAAGADDFVSKPIVGPELVTRIMMRLERVRMLRQLAEIDQLTQLTNRAKSSQDFEKFLDQAARTGGIFCLALIDLDCFKQVNDRHGHSIGDSVLRWLGGLLRRSFRRREDIVSRWGGEEFVIGLYGMNKASVARRLNEVLEILRREAFTNTNDEKFQVTFSAGVAEYPEDGTTLELLYRAADKTLYQAKEAGRNQVLVTS
ncbi:MAG: response regulator [Kastovskya adunca ATA6-11-RM4]|jgi:diguanylate cyclase (GGDEF)-like protein|nr:response regulator [Kastovskya adunca ATA6-11-RM4]